MSTLADTHLKRILELTGQVKALSRENADLRERLEYGAATQANIGTEHDTDTTTVAILPAATERTYDQNQSAIDTSWDSILAELEHPEGAIVFQEAS